MMIPFKTHEYDKFCITAYRHPRRGLLWAWSPARGVMADGRTIYAVSVSHGGFTTHDAAFADATAKTKELTHGKR